MRIKRFHLFEGLGYKKINISDNLISKLKSCDYPNNTLAKLFIDMYEGNIPDDKYTNININNLDLDNEGNITYETDRGKQLSKITKLVTKMIDSNYVNSIIKTSDIEKFMNLWKSDKIGYKIEFWKGEDILKAFNYTGLLDMNNFETSCANFGHKGPWAQPTAEKFKVYTENPNCSAVVYLEDGRVKARTTAFEGEQLYDVGEFKKGNYYKFYNTLYGEKTLYKDILKNYLDNFGYYGISRNDGRLKKNNNSTNGAIVIPFKTRVTTKYPPFDFVYVDTKRDILATSNDNRIPDYGHLRRAYGLDVH